MHPITSATQLRQSLDSLRPLSPEDEQRVLQKLRLDWNYHSNHLEGNSLTYGETKALILFGSTAQGKPLKDHIEMTGHNEALKLIEEVVKEERPLTENFIRELNKLLLKEDYQVDAITPNGKPTKKWVSVGKYKTEPNHVLTVTGEVFYFASPEETPAKMNDLIDWYREKWMQADVQPILLAAEFHYRFIRIHPFDDGNGRTARILMNFVLMQFGYPPAIIKTEDKQNYLAVLRQADAGVPEPFVEYIVTNVVRSLEIMIKGAKGEDIEEPDDLDKELALLEQRFNFSRQVIKTQETILRFYDSSITPLFKAFVAHGDKFKTFYGYCVYHLRISEDGAEGLRSIDALGIVKEESETSKVESTVRRTGQAIQSETAIIEMRYYYKMNYESELKDFDHMSGIRVTLEESLINVKGFHSGSFNKSYNQQLTEEEIDQLVKSEAKRHKEILEQKIEEINQRHSPPTE